MRTRSVNVQFLFWTCKCMFLEFVITTQEMNVKNHIHTYQFYSRIIIYHMLSSIYVHHSTELHSIQLFNFYYFILIDMTLFKLWVLTKNMSHNCGVISTHYNCICILVLTTMKMPIWVTKTCLWLLCNKITFTHPRAFGDLVKNFIHLINAQTMVHIEHAIKFVLVFIPPPHPHPPFFSCTEIFQR